MQEVDAFSSLVEDWREAQAAERDVMAEAADPLYEIPPLTPPRRTPKKQEPSPIYSPTLGSVTAASDMCINMRAGTHAAQHSSATYVRLRRIVALPCAKIDQPTIDRDSFVASAIAKLTDRFSFIPEEIFDWFPFTDCSGISWRHVRTRCQGACDGGPYTHVVLLMPPLRISTIWTRLQSRPRRRLPTTSWRLSLIHGYMRTRLLRRFLQPRQQRLLCRRLMHPRCDLRALRLLRRLLQPH